MPAITRSVLWLSFFAAILLAWAWMFMMARMMGVDWIGRRVVSDVGHYDGRDDVADHGADAAQL